MTSPAIKAPTDQPAATALHPIEGVERKRLYELVRLPLAFPGRWRKRLVARLEKPQRAIEAAYQRLAVAPPQAVEASHEAEWLLDNHYIVRRAARSLREEFPVGFERRLRVFTSGAAAGRPLVYELARELVAAETCNVDVASLAVITAAFQTERPLTIAELWALPALLRLALLEALAEAIAVIPGVDISAEGAAATDTGRVIANAIRSLRTLESADWKRFFESINVTERRLQQDPARVYAQMNFDTRDRYRKAVEEVAWGTEEADEASVAAAAVRLAGAGRGGRRGHVGYYLVDEGRQELEREVGCRPPWRLRWRRGLTGHPSLVYLGGIALLTAAALIAVAVGLRAAGTTPAIVAIAVALAVIPAVSVAVHVINDVLTRVLPARVLPKLDFSRGIPAEWRTLVAVPALLSDADEVEALLSGLEIRYLATGDSQVSFALLTDLLDAPAEHQREDDDVLKQVADGIEALNAQYQSGAGGPFHLFHRNRQWNPHEQCWMGWERKRGKLTQLNRWLLGQPGSEFALHVGDERLRGTVRFVIALDADTDLPRDAARQLAGALAHPLNRAEFQPESGAVKAGYTILQPRIEINPVSASASRFATLFAPAAGLDPYVHAVSDVYQDLFGEGTYVGKGIYDVADFERSLTGLVPDNTLLSHDLFEGVAGRAGLLSDTVLFEDFPAHYLAYTRRVERWIRGDWQLLPWLGRHVPVSDGGRAPNRLSLIARWKIMDNLRRSLVAPALLAFLFVVWLGVPRALWQWTLLAIAVPAVPLLLSAINELAAAVRRRVRRGVPSSSRSLRATAAAWFCELGFLPHTALVATKAILQTLLRVCITRRHLLQWTSAAHAARAVAGRAQKALWFVVEMGAAPLVGIGGAALLAALHPAGLPAAAPLLLLWCGSPLIAAQLSRPPSRPAPVLTASDRLRLRILARRTWSFFEAFVEPADQWLPPDYYQQAPRNRLARRTSPTNIGLAQLAVVAAADFGYCGPLSMVLQLKNTFDTLDRLDRYRGHFLNWYGTAALDPLEPRYVSTVDSGNLVASLLIVKHACMELGSAPPVDGRQWGGFLDTLAVFQEVAEGLPNGGGTALLGAIARLERWVSRCRAEPSSWRATISAVLSEHLPALETQLVALLEPDPARLSPPRLAELRRWSAALKEHLDRMQRELDLLMPWFNAWHQLPPFLTGELPERVAVAWGPLAAASSALPSIAELPAVIRRAQQQLADLRRALEAATAPEAADARAWAARFDSALAAALPA
ncbi:MAG: cellobiose phosphorylase, partial [Candidatus Binatia bacterium]